MKIIGLTGPSGAGKSTLCEKFEELDIPCIDTDKVYHAITSRPSPCLSELAEAFGDSIIGKDGALDRPSLARIVFSGENAEKDLAKLNSITHKYVFEETAKLIDEYERLGKVAVTIDAPALFSSKRFVDACDIIISVLCDSEIRLLRIMERDSISRENALSRMRSQPDDSFFIEHSDYYITNAGKKEDMVEQLMSILERERLIKI